MIDLLAPNRNEIHLPRRIFHMLGGTSIVVTGLFFEDRKLFVTLLAMLAILQFLGDLARLLWPSLNRAFTRIIKPVIRNGEQNHLTGSTYYVIGCALAAILFPREVAILAMLFLAYGDPIASIVGVMYGRKLFPNWPFAGEKSLEGSLGCFSVCFTLTLFSSYALWSAATLPVTSRLLLAIIGGASATLGEFIPLKTDDNLALPLVGGGFFWLCTSLLNLLPGLWF